MNKNEDRMRKVFMWSGVAASAIMIGFGIASLVLGINGRSTVFSAIKQERITGSGDMTPAGIAPTIEEIKAAQQKIAAAQEQAGIPAAERFELTEVSAPGCSVAEKAVDTGTRAKCFAEYMRIHALSSSGGLVYSQMGRFTASDDAPLKSTDYNGGTSDEKYALIDPKTKQPVSNGKRNLWINEVALATALNTSYMAEQISLFGVGVGVALLLTGIGFLVVLSGILWRTRRSETETTAGARSPTPSSSGG